MTTLTGGAGTLQTSITGNAQGTFSAAETSQLINDLMAAGPASVFNLNNMSSMVEGPADDYAQALELLRGISTGADIGIAQLTQRTTNVQVEQGKLEMINGIIKNAVNYLNNRARSLTQ